jgi:hypothetical protein
MRRPPAAGRGEPDTRPRSRDRHSGSPARGIGSGHARAVQARGQRATRVPRLVEARQNGARCYAGPRTGGLAGRLRTIHGEAILLHASDIALAPPGIAKGWHDAGDFSLYSASTNSALFWLLSAIADFSPREDDTGIPKSGNSVPDLLDATRSYESISRSSGLRGP